MKLDRIEIFCAVAKYMSFSKAAEECRVAQSAVSQNIKALEEEIGFPLFERSTRRVSFTDAGQSFYVDCVRILANLDEAKGRASSSLHKKRSYLTIGVEGLMQCEKKAHFIKQFAASHPHISILLKQTDRDGKYEDLLTGKIDLIFDIPQYYTLNHRIKKCCVIKNEHCLMVCKDHPLAQRESISKQELSEYVTFWGGIPKVEDYVIKTYIDYFRSSGIEPAKVSCVSEQDVATFMVAANMGGNIVPLSEKNMWNPELFSFVKLEEPLVLESAWLYSNDNLNPALAEFINALNAETENE